MTLPDHVWPFEPTEFVGNGFDTDGYVNAGASSAQSLHPNKESAEGESAAAIQRVTPTAARHRLARLLMDEDTCLRFPLDANVSYWEFSAIWHGLEPGLVDLEKPGRLEFLEILAALTLSESPALLNLLNSVNERQVREDLTRWPEAVVFFNAASPRQSVVNIRILAERMRQIPERSCTPVSRKVRQLTVYKNTEDFERLLNVSLDSFPGWLDHSVSRGRPTAKALHAKLMAQGVTSNNLVTAGATYLNSPAVRKGGNISNPSSRRSKREQQQKQQRKGGSRAS